MAHTETIRFSKYHGLGNDFVMIDNRKRKYMLGEDYIRFLCHRRLGIGADGLIEINESSTENYEFGFVYYNSDGRIGSLCGNGCRCALKFATHLGIVRKLAWVKFHVNGCIYSGMVSEEDIRMKFGALKKSDVIQKDTQSFFLDTGSPHLVNFVPDNSTVNVFEEGRKIRYSAEYETEGVNVNYVSVESDYLCVRTYERGVEEETFACGTGAVASALAYHYMTNTTSASGESHSMIIKFRFGQLKVIFVDFNDMYSSIVLEGPAKHVFDGEIAYDIINKH